MKYLRIFYESMISNNPVLILALGLCSTLAVTVKAENAFFMGAIVGCTVVISSCIVSAARYKIPYKHRLMSYMLIIVSVVIAEEQALSAFYPSIERALGPYVGLIVTNCIIMGRLEGFAASHTLLESLFDSLGVSCGYGAVLLIIASIREFLSSGAVWGVMLAPDFFVPCRVFGSSAGAFIVFAAVLYAVGRIKKLFKRAS